MSSSNENDKPNFDEMSLDELEARFGDVSLPDNFGDVENEAKADSISEPSSDQADATCPLFAELESDQYGFASGRVHPLVWQQLVDGQLPEQQYQRLLTTMENCPSLWRDCSLAFLEKQAMQAAFGPLGFNSNISLTNAEEGDDASAENRDDCQRKVTIQKSPYGSVVNLGKPGRADSSSWVRRFVAALPATMATIFLLSVAITRWDASKAPAISDLPSGLNSITALAQTFNDLPNRVRQEIVGELHEGSISLTVPSTPAMLHERHVESNREFYLFSDSEGRIIVIPVDVYLAYRLDVQ